MTEAKLPERLTSSQSQGLDGAMVATANKGSRVTLV